MNEAELILIVDCVRARAFELAGHLLEDGFQVARVTDMVAGLAAVRSLCPAMVLIHPSAPGVNEPAARAALQRLASSGRLHLNWLAPAPSWAAFPGPAELPIHLPRAVRRRLFAVPLQSQLTSLAS